MTKLQFKKPVKAKKEKIEKVREILNLPEGDFKIAPSCSSKYKIFIRSTSWNRKLVPNTEILLAK